MKVLRWLAIPLLSVSLVAQTSSAPAPTTAKKHKRRAAASIAVTQADVQSLKDALAAQQQQIQALTEQIKQRDEAWQQAQQQLAQTQAAATEAQNKAAAAEQASSQNATTVSQLQGDVKDVKSNFTNAAVQTQEEQKKVGELASAIGRFRFSGDVRIRGESFFQQGNVDRNRVRFRARFGFDAPINQDFTAGMYLASGFLTNGPVGGEPSFANPLSTNETFTGFFEKKAIGVDRAFLIYHPQAAKWLYLTGGKFAYDFPRTDITFDPDLNPEGFTERVSFDFNNPFFKNVTAEGMELLYNEVAGGVTGSGASLKIDHGVDSNAVGGYFSVKLQPIHWWTATPSFMLLNFNGADSIAQGSFPVGLCSKPTATSTGCILQPNVPAVGQPLPNPVPAPFRFINANAFTNASFIKGTGTGQTRGFVSGFEYADFIWDNAFETPWKRYPFHLKAEYEKNLRARLNTGLAPSKQDNAYWFDFNVGQQKNKHDFQIGYSWWRIEQDAVISQFNQDDQRAPTNTLQNRIYASWMVNDRVTATFTDWIGRTLNSNLQNALLAPGITPGMTDHYLKRLQFDLMYKF